jgi:6-phosphogluconolactonase
MRRTEAGMAGIIEDGRQGTSVCARRIVPCLRRAVAAAVLCLAAGCSGFFVYPGSTGNGGGGSNSTGDYVYVANAATANIAGFSVGTGTLTTVANSPYPLAASPTAMVVNPANTVLYVAAGTSIYAYGIQASGLLNALNGGLPLAAASVAAMDISPDGRWLLALDSTGIDVFQINVSTGGLTPGQTIGYPVNSPQPKSIEVAPNALFVFAALGTAGDLSFQFNNATGALSSPTALPEPTNLNSDNGLAVDANSAYLYIARSGTAGGLAVYAIGLGGAIGPSSQVTGSPVATGGGPFSVTLNKGGTDIYVANRTDGTISGFSIGSSGALTALSGSPYSSGLGVTSLAIDNSGNNLLAAASGGSPDLSLYTFDSATAGKLDPPAPYATGTDPTVAIAIAATH